jgi:saccharopine dehydrogenase-like NADP-dependent oxidoreductase
MLAKKRLKNAQRKNQRAPMKIDIHSMAKGNIFIGNEEIKSQKKNKKKKHVPKNVFSLGFDPGFTKAIVKEMVRAKYTDEKLAEQKALFSPDYKKNK